MTPEEWDELDRLFAGPVNSQNEPRIHELLEMTAQEDKHPDGFDGPCMCKACLN